MKYIVRVSKPASKRPRFVSVPWYFRRLIWRDAVTYSRQKAYRFTKISDAKSVASVWQYAKIIKVKAAK